MFTLTLDRAEYLRVRAGVTAERIGREFSCPVPAAVTAGDIVRIPARPMRVYVATVGDGYAKIAARLGVDEAELRLVNADKAVYPTCKIYY